MSIDLDRHLVETASKIAITYNERGDAVYGSSTSVACLYKDISRLSRTTAGENTLLDGYLYFSGSADVERGDIYYHSSEGYLRVEKVLKAKRLVADNAVAFIKCEVSKTRQLS